MQNEYSATQPTKPWKNFYIDICIICILLKTKKALLVLSKVIECFGRQSTDIPPGSGVGPMRAILGEGKATFQK
jgi:hypothetical protein